MAPGKDSFLAGSDIFPCVLLAAEGDFKVVACSYCFITFVTRSFVRKISANVLSSLVLAALR